MSLDSTLEYVWDKAVGGLEWLKEVVLGEFDDKRPTSAIVADMLVSFVPGVILVTSARDLTAVLIRLVKHPEKRNEVTEWMLVIGCAVPLVLPVLAAAAGAAAAGVGSVVGALGGDEVGAALRAVCLMLIERSGEMLETLIKFLRKFIKGDVIDVLRHINFTQYSDELVKYTRKFIDGLIAVTKKVAAELEHFDYGWLDSVKTAIQRLKELEQGFYAVQESAVRMIPGALGELQSRLAKALAEESKALDHSVTPMVHAPKPQVVPVEPRRVATMPGNPLGTPHGVEPPKGEPPATEPKTNLHPQTTEEPKSKGPHVPYPVQTKPNEAFFWSGRSPNPDGTFSGGAANAQVIASQNGGTTLENLIDQKGITMPPWDESNPDSVAAWKQISSDYANGASGDVNAVIGSSLRPGNVWEADELPALMNNPNVTSITTIDPATGARNLIWTR